MLKRYQQTVGNLFRVTDALIVAAAWIFSYWVRFNVPLIQVTKGFPRFDEYLALTPLVVILWYVVLSSMGLYRSQRMLTKTKESFRLIRAHGFALVLFISLTYVITEYRYSRGVILYFGTIGGLSLFAFRLAIRHLMRNLRRRGYNLRYTLAIGEGDSLEAVLWRLRRFPELGIKCQGVLTPEPSKHEMIQEARVLGTIADLRRILDKITVDQILIALPRAHSAKLDDILKELRDETLDIQIVPDIHDFITLNCQVEDFDGCPMVNLNQSPLDGWGALAKRITDSVLASLGLLALLPFLSFIALLVKLTSRGPVFYGQTRMGVDGRVFKMWKFRTMIVGADKIGDGWSRPQDDRRTPIGGFLRSTSIDELPQLWNVFRGEMSLVGPRPEQPRFVEQFRQQIPLYMLRHKVKAGITGWAQVNGWRGDTSLASRIECDLYYIRNWSYSLDLKILWLTLWKGFVHKNAH